MVVLEEPSGLITRQLAFHFLLLALPASRSNSVGPYSLPAAASLCCSDKRGNSFSLDHSLMRAHPPL